MATFVPTRAALALGAGLLAAVASACGPATVTPPEAPPSATTVPSSEPSGAPMVRIGVSNPVTNDGWRQAMVCSIKAQALASGRVEKLTVADRMTDAAGQSADIRSLVATGVDALIVAPGDPAGIKDAVAEAIADGVEVVTIGRPVDVEGARVVATDQEAYGFAGATWLFEQLGGKGSVGVFHGFEKHPIDVARDAGFSRALKAYKDIKVVSETHAERDPARAVETLNKYLATGKALDAIWVSGLDSVLVDALKIAGHPLVPIAGGDRGPFVGLLLSQDELIGAAVTDPPAVGGAAVALALDALDGKAPADPAVIITPEVWPNDTDAGRAALTAASDPDLELAWPVSVTIPGRTTYTMDELLACIGPEG
jgi:ribose transport system substrate-binding protein